MLAYLKWPPHFTILNLKFLRKHMDDSHRVPKASWPSLPHGQTGGKMGRLMERQKWFFMSLFHSYGQEVNRFSLSSFLPYPLPLEWLRHSFSSVQGTCLKLGKGYFQGCLARNGKLCFPEYTRCLVHYQNSALGGVYVSPSDLRLSLFLPFAYKPIGCYCPLLQQHISLACICAWT